MMTQAENIFTRVGYWKIFAFAVFMLIYGIGFGGFLLPIIIREVMKMQLRVTPGTLAREMFDEIPFAFDYRYYIWNVTNPEEVTAGGKPKMQYVGPYYFREYKDKVNIVDDNEADTMEYDFRNTFYYEPEKNGPGLTGQEIVTIAHPLLLASILNVGMGRPEVVPLVRDGMELILHNPKDIFYTGTVWDIFYGGFPLDCSGKKYQSKSVCDEYSMGLYPEVERLNETFFKFSLFNGFNGSSTGRFTAFRGKKNILHLGRVIRFNGTEELTKWPGKECNQLPVGGTDGTIFPPFREKGEGFRLYVPRICRTVHFYHTGSSTYAGIKSERYTMDYDTSQLGSPNCFCRDNNVGGQQCPPKGMFDMFPCTSTPITLSLPHFYNLTDPEVLGKIEGMKPDREKHDLYIDIYQLSGTPLRLRVRTQANIEILPLQNVPLLKDLPRMYIPLYWFEESFDLEKKFVNMLKYQLVLGLKLQKLTKYGGALVGVIGMIFGSIACYIQIENENNQIRPISNQSNQSNKSDKTLDNPKVNTIEVISNE